MKINIDRTTNKATGASAPSVLFLEINVDDSFKLEKTIEEQEGEKQKVNDQGQPLYKSNIQLDEMGQETYDEVTEENENPVMIPNLVPKVVSIKDQPEAFTLEEVLEAKYRGILETSLSTYIVADSFLEESDLDLTDPNHSANTGMGICEIHPGGQVKTKTINLVEAAATFTLLELDADPGVEIYVAGQAFVDGVATLASPVNSCTIRFENTTYKPKAARAYAIGY